MSHYRSVAHRTGSPDAIELAAQLSAWHDRMVAHERALSVSARGCDDSCPHAESLDLWQEALQAFGAAADHLQFLKATATSVASPEGTGR